MPSSITRVSPSLDFETPLNVQGPAKAEGELASSFQRAEPKPSDQLAGVEQRKETSPEMSWTEWGNYALGVIDAFNPLTPVAESIASGLGLEAERPPEYWQGRVEGGNAALVVDVAIIAGGSAMIGGSATCEVATVGICTPVAGAGALTGGAVALAGGGLMAMHGSGVERAKAQYLESKAKDNPSHLQASESSAATSQLNSTKTNFIEKIQPELRKKWSNIDTLEDHFVRHGPDFKAQNAEDYIKNADQFLKEAKQNNHLIKTDHKGVMRVYDPKTNTFGSLNPDGTIKTFYKPKPRSPQNPEGYLNKSAME